MMTLTIEIEREEDRRWIAEVPGLSGVLCYGGTRDEAIARVQPVRFTSSPSAWSTEKHLLRC
jgi:predicted RNase H-like HicB family nuclease